MKELKAISIKLLQERLQAAIKKDQEECPHLQGSSRLSFIPSHLTSIVWHRYNDDIVRGICTNCQRKFVPEDDDYKYWRGKRSGNILSEAGDRIEIPVTKEEYEEGSKYQFNWLDGNPKW